MTDPGTATYVSTLFKAVSINAVQGGSASNVVADDTVLVRRPPTPPDLPTAVWINSPAEDDTRRFIDALRLADATFDRDDLSHFLGEPAFVAAARRAIYDADRLTVRQLLHAYRRAVFSAFEANPALRPLYGTELTHVLDLVREAGISTIGIVSNERRWAPRVYLERVLRVDLALFDPVITSGELGYGKPDPRVFREALRRAGLSASETAYVGDSSERDMAPVIALGMMGFWFRALLPQPTEVPPPGSIPIDDIKELPTLLRMTNRMTLR